VLLAVTPYCVSVPVRESKCIIVWGLRLTRRLPQLNSNGNYRVSALVQVNNEHLATGCLLKFDEVESMFEFEESKMCLSENTVIFIFITDEGQIPK